MKLQALYKTASAEEWARLAAAAGVTPEYLGQVARGWARQRRQGGPKKRVRLSFEALAKLAAADRRLNVRDLVVELSEPAREAA